MSFCLPLLLAATLLEVQPADPNAVVLAAYGDVRRGHVIHARLAADMLTASPDAVLMTGDLVQDGNPIDWAAFESATRTLRANTEYFAAVGNHDVAGIFNESRIGEYFPTERWFEVVIGRVTVFVVDTNQAFSPASAQGQWLEKRLAAAHDAGQWLIVMHHHPVYSTGPHGSNARAVRDLQPLYERYGVHLVLQGHDHHYERAEINGVTYVTAGGGGAPLYWTLGVPEPPTEFRASIYHWVQIVAKPDTLEIAAIDLGGNRFDEVVVPFDHRGRAVAPPPGVPTGRVLAALGTLVLAAGFVTVFLQRRR